MEDCAIHLACEGLGDCLYAIPVLRRIWLTGQTLYRYHVFTHHPALFRNCPYVASAHHISSPEFTPFKQSGRVLNLFEFDGRLPHHRSDTRDYISIPLGIGSLSLREKQLEYYPSEPDTATAYDVVLNTSQTWPTRSWEMAYWQRLADVLLARGLSVAVVGRDVESKADGIVKRSMPLRGCVDLVNRLSLDQSFYTIARCGLFVTGQGGLSVLAGATEAAVVVIGMSIEWSQRPIIRHQDPHYRARYVEGSCTTFCGSAKPCLMADRGHEEYRGRYRCIPEYAEVEAAVLAALADFPRQPA